LNITLDKFRIGTITTLEFRTAQLNYVNAKVRYSNAQFKENYLKLHFASWQEILILLLLKKVFKWFHTIQRLVYIYRFHKADTFRTLMPIMFAIGVTLELLVI
jgi:hypothetical protein